MVLTARHLIDAIKARSGRTDAELATHLGTSRSVVTEARAGTQDLKLEFKLVLAADAGYDWAEAAVRNLIGRAGEAVSAILTSKTLIDEYKKKFDATDLDVAAQLSISRSVVTEARNGTQELKLTHKLVLADKIGYAWARKPLLLLLGNAGAAVRSSDNARLLHRNR